MKNELLSLICQVSTPVQRSSGIFLPKYNIVVASYTAVGGYKKVVLRSPILKKQLVRVEALDPVLNLAFLRANYFSRVRVKIDNSQSPEVGQVVKVYYRTYSRGVESFTSSIYKIESEAGKYVIGNTFNNSLSLGGLAADLDGNPLGIVSKEISNERLEVVSFKLIYETLVEIIDFAEEYAFRCPYCNRLLSNDLVSLGKCAFCGKILPEELYEDFWEKTDEADSKIRQIIKVLNYDPDIAFLEKNYWEIDKSGIKVLIHYEPESSAFCGFTVVGEIGRDDKLIIKDIYRFLLEENNKLESMSLSINERKIILSTIYFNLDNVSPASLVEVFRNLFAKGAYYKELFRR